VLIFVTCTVCTNSADVGKCIIMSLKISLLKSFHFDLIPCIATKEKIRYPLHKRHIE